MLLDGFLVMLNCVRIYYVVVSGYWAVLPQALI